MFIVSGVLFFPLWGLGPGASKAAALDGDEEHAVPNRPLCIEIASMNIVLLPWKPGPHLDLRPGIQGEHI